MCVHMLMHKYVYAPALEPVTPTVFMVRIKPGFGLWWKHIELDKTRQDKTRQDKTKLVCLEGVSHGPNIQVLSDVARALPFNIVSCVLLSRTEHRLLYLFAASEKISRKIELTVILQCPIACSCTQWMEFWVSIFGLVSRANYYWFPAFGFPLHTQNTVARF
jgi:hypothetical protein